jgi:hypothetical protein
VLTRSFAPARKEGRSRTDSKRKAAPGVVRQHLAGGRNPEPVPRERDQIE